MLIQLRIRNVALIEDQVLEFGPGMNVLTGETGAGKSIILGSLNLVLGMRASSELIRTGSESAYVEAVFELAGDSAAYRRCVDLGLEGDNSGEVVLARELSVSGKNACRVNGIRVTLAVLKEIGDLLVDIHGQHEHQSLLNSAAHLALLDEYGGTLTGSLLAKVRSLHHRYSELKARKEALERSERERLRQLDLLQFQAGEIDRASIKDGEDELLEREQSRLENAEELKQIYEQTHYELYESGPDGSGLVGRLNDLLAGLEKAASMDGEAKAACEQFREAAIILQDIAIDLRGLADRCQVDPEALGSVTDRLNLLNALKRKYGPLLSDVAEFRRKVGKEIDELESSSSELRAIGTDIERIYSELSAAAKELSAIRKRLSKELGEAVEKGLRELGMDHARFAVRVASRGHADESELAAGRSDDDGIGPTGIDRVEMLFSANEGEPLKPLTKVASGGELSRIMLVIRTILSDLDEIPVVIFDEVDVGIGGVAAHRVASKMADIAVSKQVLCVTHLAQIASVARHHFHIEKITEDGSTHTVVSRLTEEEKEIEVARMIDGQVNELTLSHAREMIRSARRATPA